VFEFTAQTLFGTHCFFERSDRPRKSLTCAMCPHLSVEDDLNRGLTLSQERACAGDRVARS